MIENGYQNNQLPAVVGGFSEERFVRASFARTQAVNMNGGTDAGANLGSGSAGGGRWTKAKNNYGVGFVHL